MVRAGIASLGLLIAVVLSARSATNDLTVAREALRDGLWSVARKHAVQAKPVDEARLVILESWAGEEKWDEVAKELARWPDAKGDGFDYYRAVVRGDHAAAMEILKRVGSAEGLVEVRLHEAEQLANGGDRVAASALWRMVAVASNATERTRAIASANLMDVDLLRQAYKTTTDLLLRQFVGLRLGRALLRDAKTAAEGAALVRALVKESPDADGARDAYLDIAAAEASAGRWKESESTYARVLEIWPDAVKSAAVQKGRGETFRSLGRRDEALEAFEAAERLSATNDSLRAEAMALQGDVLTELGKADEALVRYRAVLANYPKTAVAARLKSVIETREIESKGREHYRNFRFEEAAKAFAEVAARDPVRRARMEFYAILCLYGQGRDDEAFAKAQELAGGATDAAVMSEVKLWLAKFLYNRREWKKASALFAEYAAGGVSSEDAATALLWAARAEFAASDYKLAIQRSTELAEKHPSSPTRLKALLVQGEALMESARFDEAALVFGHVAAAEGATAEDRVRAQTLRADALYALGADNPSRYRAALEAYRSLRFGGALSASQQLVLSFKIARVLEKLNQMDEALDQYYTQVVLAYRFGRQENGHFTEEARAAFSRAAFRLADEYESRGWSRQVVSILELVAASDVPAAAEAAKRLGKMTN